MLEINNLHVKLEDEDKVILRGVDLKIGPGEVKSRPKEPSGAVVKPPKGSAACWSAGMSALRKTGRRARAARSRIAAGSMPARWAP